jgi:hypothetical protein
MRSSSKPLPDAVYISRQYWASEQLDRYDAARAAVSMLTARQMLDPVRL